MHSQHFYALDMSVATVQLDGITSVVFTLLSVLESPKLSHQMVGETLE